MQTSTFLSGENGFLGSRIYKFLFKICHTKKKTKTKRLGVIAVSKKAIIGALSRGKSIFIVIGGASEALDARPGDHCIVLGRRKGFVKIALQTGAHLVPVFSFGENLIYDQPENPRGSFVRKIQVMLKSTIGVTLPLPMGRGVFNYTFGLLPFREQLTTIVGAPIELPKIEKPTIEEIDQYHALYIERLSQLYIEWSEKLNVKGRLIIVE